MNPKDIAIENIILDLGGVLLNIDYQKTIQAFKDLGIQHFDQLYTQAQQSDLFDELEKGTISASQFLNRLSTYLPSTVQESEIRTAWNAMLLSLPKERLSLLEELNKKYRVVLLSNTNVIHLESFYNTLYKDYGINSLDKYFETVYFSCEMQLRKPNEEIFKKVCQLERFEPKKTLFIDDSIQHVEGAKEMGLQAHHLDVTSDDIIQKLDLLLA